MPAGGSSITAVTPSSPSIAMQASHRTGRVTCATSLRRVSAPVSTTLPSALESRGRVGSAGAIDAACARSASSAGAMNRVWNAPATASGTTRARSGFCSASWASAGSGPAATICPAPLRLAGSSPNRSSVASTSSRFPPSTALMPVGSRAQAAAISRPRTAASATAASGSSTPAMAAAASSPTECPATGAPGGRSSLRAASSAVATTSGCVTAVSLISSALAVVPRRCRSRSTAADHRASVASASGASSHGVSMPGDCDPWPGARSAITR